MRAVRLFFILLVIVSMFVFASCSDSGSSGDDDSNDGDETDGDDAEDGDVGNDDPADAATASGDEGLRGYFCESDSDCASGERCIPFSDASAKICQPEDFIRFTDDQTFIIDTSSMTFSFESDSLEQDVINAKGFASISEPGNPDLPSISFNVLLPSDADLASVSFEVLSGTEDGDVIGSYNIAPAGPANWRPDLDLSNTFEDYLAQRPYIVDGRNTNVYDADAFWPENSVKLGDASQMRKWKFVRVTFVPFSYNPASGTLKKISYIKVHITAPVKAAKKTLTAIKQHAQLMSDTVFELEAANMFANFDKAKKDYMAPPPPEDGETPPKSDYLIMTTNKIVEKSAALDKFVQHKKSIGYSVLVITEDEYGELEGKDTAEKARNWLKAEYARRGIQYLLIIADPNGDDAGPPMRVCWPRYNKEDKKDNWEKTATDAYYADLTGNWDKDGDGIWCEYGYSDGDTGSGGVDLSPELYVGRIPVYKDNTDRLDDILEMTIAYELQGDIEWRNRVLLPNPISDFSHEIDHGGEDVDRGFTVDGAKFAEKMKRGFLNKNDELSTFSLYDIGGAEPSKYDPDLAFSEDAVCQEWVKGNGIISWWAHGNSSSAAGKRWPEDKNDNKIADENEKKWVDFAHNGMSSSCFDSDKPAFTSQVSCLNHRPDRSNNLGHYLLYKGGAVSTMGATSVTLYSPSWSSPNSRRMDNVSFGYYYTEYLSKNYSAGRALAMVRSKPCSFSWGDGTLMNMLSFNVYGDPSVSVFTTYKTAEEGASPLYEDKGHAFDKAAQTDAGPALSWDLYYNVQPGDIAGDIEVSVALYDEDGKELKNSGAAVAAAASHTISDSALVFDGDAPDTYSISYGELEFLGGGEHSLQYDITVVFKPAEGDEELFFAGSKKSFAITIEEDESITDLANGVPASGQLSNDVESQMYRFELLAAADVAFTLDGPESGADFDLYVKRGEMPTESSYDGKGYSSSANENIELDAAEAGEYFVLVTRYSGAGSYTLTASVAGSEEPTVTTLSLDEVVEDTMSEGEIRMYKFEAAYEGDLYMMLEGEGDARINMYLKKSEEPSATDYDAKADEDAASKVLEAPMTVGEYYLMLEAAKGGPFQLLGWIE